MTLCLLPPCFVVLRTIPEAALSSVTWDNVITDWVDKTFHFSAQTSNGGFWNRTFSGDSHKWMLDLITIPLVIWCMRFITGALEEVRHTSQATPLHLVEILSRWLALSMALPICVPVLGGFLYHTLRFFQLWEPLSALASLLFMGFLCFWSWQYPNRRIKHVEKVFHFERLKSEV